MARGDIHWFNRAGLDGFKKVYDLSADTIKLGIITSANAPTVNTPDPAWGANGSTNLSLDQVTTNAGGYSGPITLASVTFSQVANIPTLAANSVVIVQDSGNGFTDAAYGALFDDSHANKPAFAFIDLGGPVGNQNGPVNINFNSSAVSGPILTTTAT
jgi:hypothetical protein